MEFYIHSDRYFLREQEDRSFRIMVLSTNQQLNFDAPVHPLMKAVDRWVDFSSFVRTMEMVSFLRGDLRGLLEAAVFSMHAAGVAELRDVPSSGKTGTRWAKLKDYYALSLFMRENYSRGMSCAVAFGEAYYGFRSIHTALKNGEKYILMKEEEGVIRAVAEFGFSERFFGNRIFELKSFIFDGEMDEEACRKVLSELVAYARETLKGKTPKLRYEYIHPRQALIADALRECGFHESARFREEIRNGMDLVLLDLI